MHAYQSTPYMMIVVRRSMALNGAKEGHLEEKNHGWGPPLPHTVTSVGGVPDAHPPSIQKLKDG